MNDTQEDSILDFRDIRARAVISRMIRQGIPISQAILDFPEEERSLWSLLLSQFMLTAIARQMVGLDGITQEQSDELEAFLEMVTTYFIEAHTPPEILRGEKE